MIDLPLYLLSPDFVVQETLYSFAAQANVQVVRNDPTRFAIVFSSTITTFNLWLSTKVMNANSQGFQLTSQQLSWTLIFPWHGPLTTLAWNCWNSGVVAGLDVFEIFYRPVSKSGDAGSVSQAGGIMQATADQMPCPPGYT